VWLPGEDKLLARADAILCVSDPVYDRHAERYGAKVHFVPVACDFAAWRAAADEIDPRLQGMSRPVFGYSGWINDRVDVDLLAELASRTSGTVVLAGPVERVSLRNLERAPNVVMLGPQAADAVPRIVNGFDVALIPYVDSAFNRGSNPVKFYEYLALGKAVVATDVPTLRRFAEIASIGDTPSFVDRALAPVPGDADARREIARQHSFPVLLERLGALNL
jgi:glycosyltransferase involved in cell wall biosynthesis